MITTALEFFTQYSELTMYAAFFLVLCIGWFVVPITEEAVLLAGGYLAYAGYTNIYLTGIACLSGSIAGDLVLYLMGRLWGARLFRLRPLRPFLSERRQQKAQGYFSRYGTKALLIARFFSGFRLGLFLAAGSLRMQVGKFILFDFIAALFNLVVMLGLSYHFGEHIDTVLYYISRFERLTALIVLVFIAAIAVYVYRRRQLAVSE